MVIINFYPFEAALEKKAGDLDAMLESGPMVVEWADRIQEALPIENLRASFVWIDENQRDMVFVAHGSRYEAMLAAIRKQIFGVR